VGKNEEEWDNMSVRADERESEREKVGLGL
jgi:hypothetical protein